VVAAKKENKKKKCAASRGHITNLKQSIFSFDIYEQPGRLTRQVSLVNR
jgi:hypothetical protein